MRAERALVLHERLPQLQQLGVLLGVHPPQVLHVLDHHLHRLADAVLLQEERERWGGGRFRATMHVVSGGINCSGDGGAYWNT